MVLTRSMKDIWLFGGLDTLKSEGADTSGAKQEDVKVVAQYIQTYLKYGEGNGAVAEAKEERNSTES